MALTATEQGGGKAYPPCPSGPQIARCVWVVDLGTTEDATYNKMQNKVLIGFEVPEEKYVFDEKRGPEPYFLKRKFTLSLAEKSALRPALESWRGRKFTPEELKGFRLDALLDKPCIINVAHAEKDGKTYAQIATITPLMKGMVCPPRVSPLVIYDIGEGDNAAYKAMPEWLRKEIAQSEEWKQRQELHPPIPEPATAGPGDDFPPF